MRFDIPFIRPVFPDASVLSTDYTDIIASNWFTNFGPKEREFSAAIAQYVGGDVVAVTFSNATIGLMAVLQGSLGRGDGSRHVIVPSFTFAAGPEAIEWVGYRPLFVDIDGSSLQPDIEGATAALRDPAFDVAGILLCNTFGIGNPEIGRWEELAERFGVPLLIDSAAGFGSAYADGSRVGSAGLAEVFSFHATKPFAIGEGGAVVTRDTRLAESLASFQNFGFERGAGAARLGLNGKLQEINAAIGLRQLEGFDAAIRSRQSVLSAYVAALAGESRRFPTAIEDSAVCFASVLFDSRATRDGVLRRLVDSGVEARAYYSPAVHLQPHFADAARIGDLSVTMAVVDTVLSLPVHQDMPDDQVARVISIVGAD